MDENKQSILLAEDDAVLQEMYKERLTAEGFAVDLAKDGLEALDKIQNTTPSLMILDIMMPNLNGIDVLKKIKASDKTKNIPVIVATALVQDMTEIKKMLGANDSYLIKSEVMSGDVIKLVKDKLGAAAASNGEAPVAPAEPAVPEPPVEPAVPKNSTEPPVN